MRKIIGRSDMIMATPLKNKLLIGIRTVWRVSRQNVKAFIIRSCGNRCLTGHNSESVRLLQRSVMTQGFLVIFAGIGVRCNESPKNH